MVSFDEYAEVLRSEGVEQAKIDEFKRRLEAKVDARGEQDSPGSGDMLQSGGTDAEERDDEFIYRMVP